MYKDTIYISTEESVDILEETINQINTQFISLADLEVH